MKKNIWKRLLSLALTLVLAVGLLPDIALKAKAASGTCGDNLTWSLSGGTMTISGTGAMADYTSYVDTPWTNEQARSVTKLVIEKGVTWIDSSAFVACYFLSQVIIRGNTTLDSYAFSNMSNITSVEYGGSVKEITYGAFVNNENLSSFTLREGIGRSGEAFKGSYTLKPNGIKLVNANGVDVTSNYSVSVYDYMFVRANLSKGSVNSIPDQQYTGSAVQPAVTVKWNGQTIDSSNYSVTYSNNTEPGTATVTVTGKDERFYTGTLTKTFTILEPKDITGVSARNVTATYDGNAHGITVTGAPAGATITFSSTKDGAYTATQPSIVNVADSGTVYYKVAAPGYKVFSGSATVTINPRNVSALQVADIADQTYTGSVIIPSVAATYMGETLGDADYTLSGSSVNVGSATVTITGQGNFTGTIVKTFNIKALDISRATVIIEYTSNTYTGSHLTPTVAVMLDGRPLTGGTDYILSYSDNTTPGLANLTVTGQGNYTGSKTAYFDINNASLTNVRVEQTNVLTYDGTAHTPEVTASATTVDGAEVTFTYSTEQNGTYGSMPSFDKAGTYTVYYKAAAPNHGEAKGSFTVTVNKATVTEPTIESKVYNGSNQTADVPASDLYTVEENNGGIGVLENGKGYNVVLKLKNPENYKWSSTDEAEVTLSFKITRATNEWEQTPSIEGWTYGEIAKVPVGTAKFGDVSVEYSGTANDGTSYISTDAPTKAGSYKATFIVAETENYSGLETPVDFTIGKATYDMSGAKWDYAEAIKYDGKAHSVWVDENSLPNGVSVSNYTGNTYSDVGKYTANVSLIYDYNNYNEPDFNYLLDWEIVNNWTPTEYTVSGEGWMNQNVVITPKDGYLISLTNTANGTWEDALTYSEETDNGSVIFYLKNETDGTISLAKTVTYKLDKTDPTGKVEFVERTGWETFLNTITFNLFYKDEVTVKVTANDALSGVAKIEYASSDKAMTLNEVKDIADWTEYNGEFGVTKPEAEKFVYFIRITDNAGNVTYLSTDGAEYDITAPVISGVENGKTYYTTQIVTVIDKNIDTITLSGETATGSITLEGNKEATYTIVATDKAGNVTELTVTMKHIASISAPIDGMTESNVNSGNAEIIADAEAAAAAVDTTNATDEEKAAIKAITDKCDTLQEVIADTAAEYERITDAIAAYDPEKVTSDDKADLDKLAEDLEALVESGNLADSEKTALETPTAALNSMVDTVADVAEEAARITDVVGDYELDTVNSSDKDEIEQLVEDIDALLDTDNLTDEERSELENLKTKCNSLIAKIDGTETLIDQLDKTVDDLDAETVKSTDKAALEQVIADAETLIDSGNVTEAEKEALKQTQEDAKALIKVIDDTAAENKALTDQAATFDKDAVKSTDKTALEQLAQNIEDLLDTQNLTEDERIALETILEQVEGMIDTINETAEDSKTTTETIYALDPTTVTSDDVNELEQAIAIIDELLKDDHLTEDERKALEDAKADAEALLDAIEEADKAADTENTAKVEDVTADNVTPEDKSDLEDAKADLEKALEDNNGNYTEEEKQAIQDAIDRIDNALEVIANVETVENAISELPATVEPDDEETVAKIEDAKKAYDELTEYEKSLVDKKAKEKLDDLTAAAVAYKIIKGDNGKWAKDSASGLSITVNGPLAKFSSIEIDGKAIDAKHYDAAAGSTVITLKASYLETLSVGEHTIAVVYTDGEAEGTFKIQAESTTLTTGADSNTILYGSVFAIILAALVVLILVIKKRKQAS